MMMSLRMTVTMMMKVVVRCDDSTAVKIVKQKREKNSHLRFLLTSYAPILIFFILLFFTLPFTRFIISYTQERKATNLTITKNVYCKRTRL